MIGGLVTFFPGNCRITAAKLSHNSGKGNKLIQRKSLKKGQMRTKLQKRQSVLFPLREWQIASLTVAIAFRTEERRPPDLFTTNQRREHEA